MKALSIPEAGPCPRLDCMTYRCTDPEHRRSPLEAVKDRAAALGRSLTAAEGFDVLRGDVKPATAKVAPLKPQQLNALATLASNPGYAYTPPAILSLLRKQGLVGKVKGRDESGRQKTTSPITEAGRTLLASQGLLPIGVPK